MPETPVYSSAAVAAPHHLAATAGQTVLAQGGNAIEAMAAMAATIAVVYPHMNGIGGDGFWLVREPGGRVRGIEACGPAGSLATVARYRSQGHETIPSRGPDAALTVAGAIGRLAARPRPRQGAGRPAPPRDLAVGCDPPCAPGLRGVALRGALRAEGARHAARPARFRADLPRRGQALRRWRHAPPAGPRRYARTIGPCGGSTIFYRGRPRPRDRRRSRPPRFAGDAGRSRSLRAARAGGPVPAPSRRDALQLPAAHPGDSPRSSSSASSTG